jgi:hypothetical protein
MMIIFGEKYITINEKDSYDRANKDFVKDGIVDVLALSKCKYIYGSRNSSYSLLASNLGNKRVVL